MEIITIEDVKYRCEWQGYYWLVRKFSEDHDCYLFFGDYRSETLEDIGPWIKAKNSKRGE